MSPEDQALFAALDRHEAALVAWRDNPAGYTAAEASEAFTALCDACKALGWDGGVSVPRLGIQEVPTVFALKRKVAWLQEELADLKHGMSLMHSADQGPYLTWRNAKIEKSLRERAVRP